MENSSDGELDSEKNEKEEAGVSEENVYNEKEKGDESSTFDFEETSWRSDFVLIVEGKRLYVARIILMLASPVFERMFLSEFKEKSRDELELPGKKKEQVVEFLRFIYPNAPTRFACDTARNILPLAEEYQVMNLKSRCEDVMIESINSGTTALEIFHFLRDACMYDLRKLKEKCVDTVTERDQKDLDEAKQQCHIPAEGWAAILEKLNHNLRIRLSEMEKTVKDLSEKEVVPRKQFRDFETENKLMTEKLEIIKQFVDAESKFSGGLGLDSTYNWKSRQLILIFNIKNKGVAIEENITIWEVPLTISVNVSEALSIRIENKQEDIECKVVIKSVLVCRQSRGKNETLIHKDYMKRYCQYTSHDLKKITRLKGLKMDFCKTEKLE